MFRSLIGNSVLMVSTEEHRVALVKSLERLGVDIRGYARKGCFAMCDATDTLSMFMINGLPDADLFAASIGPLLNNAKKAARSKDQGLTVFGEMVAVLWESGNKAGALALEKLWNDAMHDQVFHLHCAYPGWLFSEDPQDQFQICELHSHTLGLAPTAPGAFAIRSR